MLLGACGVAVDDDARAAPATCQTVAAAVCQKACACRDDDSCLVAYGDHDFPAVFGHPPETCEAWVANLYGCDAAAPRISVSACNTAVGQAACEDVTDGTGTYRGGMVFLPESCSPNFIEDCMASPAPSQACCEVGAC